MRRIIPILAVAAFLAPATALAAKPPHPTTPATPTVAYTLRGTLTAYTPAVGNTNGSVTIAVKSAISGTNHVAAALRNHTFTLVVTSSTQVTLHKGVFTANDKGTVKFRGHKGLTTANGQTATQVIDQGPSS
jgi:hypothetical protein